MTRTRPYQLLIADDDDRFRDVLKAIFEPWFSLLEAESGEMAVSIIERGCVDLVVLDMHMRELTGLETIRIARRINADLPCILVTADATDELREEAREAEAWSVLSKPVRRDELVETVSTAIGSAYGDPDVFSAQSFMN